MRIIVIGDGKIGHHIAAQLVSEGHEVTIIDRDESVLQRSMDTLDALVVKGNGVSTDTLTEAGVQHADVVIAVTANDEINMLCSLTAKKLGAKYTISRVRDPEYMKSLPFLMKELFIDYAINPERNMALEISRILRYPFSGNVETFARGRVEMLDFVVQPHGRLAGVMLKDLYRVHRELPRVLFCAVERNHQAIIPKGDFVFAPDDRVFVAADLHNITAFFNAIGKNTRHIRRVMVLGGSRIAFYLTSMLLDMDMDVTIVEIDPERARELSEELPHANIVLGDGTDHDLLESEGLTDSDAFVTLSGLDEENIMSGLYAIRRGVPKVIVKNNRDNYAELLQDLGLDSVVNTKYVTSNTILRAVRTRGNASPLSGVQRLYRMMDGKAEALEFIAKKDAAYTGIPLRALKVRQDALVAVIVRAGRVVVPMGDDTLEPDDRIIVIVKGNGVMALEDVVGRA